MRSPLSAILFARAVAIGIVLPSVMSTPLLSRSVWVPAITLPCQGDVWTVGSTQVVTWDVEHPPSQITNPRGRILLGYLDESGSEHLDVDHPLADGFDLHDGQHNITVPSVQPKDSYIVALLGDSSNISPMFTIST